MAVANAKVNFPVVSGLSASAVGLPANFDGVDNTQTCLRAFGSVSVDANPATYTTGGIPLVNPKALTQSAWSVEPIKVTSLTTGGTPTPVIVYIESVGGSGFVYGWNKATNKMQIFTGAAAQSPLTELTNAAAIPAGVSGDTILLEAVFARI